MESLVNRETCIMPHPQNIIIKKETDSDNTGENSE